ncbi:photosystem I assembly protein Ycf3 [compost metagenome]
MNEITPLKNSLYSNELDSAWDLFKDEKIESAKVKAQNLIQLYPDRVGCYYLLGHIHLNNQKFTEAIEAFNTALRNDKENSITGYIYYWIGQIHGMGGPFSEENNPFYDKKMQLGNFRLAQKAGNYPIDLIFQLQSKLTVEERINLFKEGVEKFKNSPDCHLLLANIFERKGLLKEQWAILKTALDLDLNSSTIYFNAAKYQFFQKQFELSIEYFNKAIEILPDSNNHFAMYYLIAKASESLGKIDEAIVFFTKALNDCSSEDDKLFGFLGLVNLYIEQDKSDSIEELITNFDFNENLLTQFGRPFGGALFLDGHYPDSIEISDIKILVKRISTIKLVPGNDLFNGKISLLKSFLATSLNKLTDAYKHVIAARKYLNYIFNDLLNNMHFEVLCELLMNKFENKAEIKKTGAIVLSDIITYDSIKTKMIVHLNSIVTTFYKEKEFQSIISFSENYSDSILLEQDILFELAYSYAELGNQNKAKVYYEYQLSNVARSSAVLNNLGNIYKKEGQLQKAIELFKEGLKLEPNDDTLTRNLQNVERHIKDEEDKANRLKIQKQNYQKSIDALRLENDFVLDRLSKFINRVKNEEAFDSWRVPIAKFKFHVFSGVDQQVGEKLREQWLKKGYIVDTTLRADRSVTIYEINPFLENELIKIQKQKIPEKWLNGFLNISIGSLEAVDYFNIIDRIGKLNKKFQPLIERDFNELVNNYLMGHEKATIVLSGSLVELVLTYYCERKKITTITVLDSKNNPKKKKLYDCVLSDLIEYIEQTRPFGNDFIHLSNLSRIYRNFIHPGRELKDSLDKSKADICFVSTREILRRVLLP